MTREHAVKGCIGENRSAPCTLNGSGSCASSGGRTIAILTRSREGVYANQIPPSPPREPDQYFEWMYRKWNTAWQRFGEHPRLAGLRVLDFGCGFGAFSVRAAEEGAAVVGLDLNREEISRARVIASERFGTSRRDAT